MRPDLAPPAAIVLALCLAACADNAASPPEQAPAASQELKPGAYQPDPEDIDCGVNCEPYSARPCDLSGGGTAAQVCGPTGLGYSACGGQDWQPQKSACGEGTRCVKRSPTGNLGCRAICQAAGSKGCGGGLERVECKAPAPVRAEAAGCEPGDGEGVYCCKAGSAILNPL